ncbi:hypothetical protein JW805_04030 [Roseomonas aeriglobus]|nr:hypothetical protein [Roseomonas aeriglobus]
MDVYVEAATALFSRLAKQHALSYEVNIDSPFEALWTFPNQRNLLMPVTLGSRSDELSFGVADFWSDLFPFEEAAPLLERIFEAWMRGDARVVKVPLGGRALQLRDGDKWVTTYRANCLLPVPRNPKQVIANLAVPAASG